MAGWTGGVDFDLSQADNGLRVKRSNTVYQHMRDPAFLRYYYKAKTVSAISALEMSGSSPTDIFVGRYGYPYVNIGPLVPPEFGDTSLLAVPERWRYLSIDKIVDYRSKLVRGMFLSKVGDVEKGKVQEQVRDLALAERPAEADMSFVKRPFVKMEFRDEVQPYGPSAGLRSLDLHNIKADKKVESRYMDTDAKASTAILELYDKAVNVSKIQMALSAGLFGVKGNRKFVPTRWSITAVDDTISKRNREEVKEFSEVDCIYAFYNVALDNRWLIFFMPGQWQYESIEAWYPHTLWNEDPKSISIYGSYEGYKGRSAYAEIGGCYYAARLAVTERLKEMRKQARVLILRETHEGYIMPVGVWNVREHVRETLATTPVPLHSYREMFQFIASKMDISGKEWTRNSKMLSDIMSQRRIVDFVG